MISDRERIYWVLAEGVGSATSEFRNKLIDEYEWVETEREVELLSTRLHGAFIASLVGEVEQITGGKFSNSIELLPTEPTKKMSGYWFEHMPEHSTARDRANIIWALRLLYTHGMGKINSISDPKVKKFIDRDYCQKHFKGIQIRDGELIIGSPVLLPTVKTILQLLDIYEENA